MQRSMSLLRRQRNILSLNHFNKNSILRPQYIAIRKYFNPDADHVELSPTAWKEKRLYRYYKFSENLKGQYKNNIYYIFRKIATISKIMIYDIRSFPGLLS